VVDWGFLLSPRTSSERRIARAFDLSAKRKDLPAELREYSAYDVSQLYISYLPLNWFLTVQHLEHLCL
jgi:hypothetical protein